MAGLTRGYLDELKAYGAFNLLEVQAEAKLDSIVTKLVNELGAPYRLSATWPTRDAILHFAAPRSVGADGGARIPPIQDDISQLGAAEITLNVQTGAITGGTIVRNGATFSLPSANQNEYVRAAFVQKSDGSIDSNWSTPVAAYGSLPDPGTLFATLDGNPLGFIDLQQTTAGSGSTYKTADSLTDIVEPAVGGVPRIWRFGSGSGVGAGGDSSFKLQSITGTTALIKKGRWDLGVKQLISGNVSTDQPVDISLDLAVLLASPLAATVYHLLIDLNDLPAASVMSDTGVTYHKVYATGHFNLYTDQDFDRRRYVRVGTIKTAGAEWTGAKVISSPARDNSPEVVANTTRVRTTLESAAKDMPYELLTLCDMGDSPETLIGAATTGTLSYAERTLNLSGSGSILVSGNLLDQAEFIDDGLTVEQIDLVVIWKAGKVSSAATYFASRNGGSDWEEITMARIGNSSDTFMGRLIFSGAHPDTSNLQIKVVAGASNVAIDGFGVFYRNIDAGQMVYGRSNFEVQNFDSNSVNEFTLSRFIPDPDLILAVCDGAIYKFGDFTLDGHKITFPVGFFDEPVTETKSILFLQFMPGTNDSSSVSAALLASNHVGSTDPNLDRSLSGRGIMLRADDGVLVEAGLVKDEETGLYAWQFSTVS